MIADGFLFFVLSVRAQIWEVIHRGYDMSCLATHQPADCVNMCV